MSGQRTKANDAKLDNLKRGGATPEMAAKARAANIRKSGAVMDNAMIYIERARTAGCTTLQQLADALNQGGVPTRHGGKWHPTSVWRVLRRHKLAAKEGRVMSEHDDGPDEAALAASAARLP